MADDGQILIGSADDGPVGFDLRFANRHGLIAGATGTGKSVTLQVLAESFSRNGVPVFLADVKGDLSGLAAPPPRPRSSPSGPAAPASTRIAGEAAPVVFWDVFGKAGHPVRATVSEMGPLLLARLLGLNDTQEGVLQVVFAVADDQGLLLLDLKDLRAMLAFVSDNAKELRARYGNVGAASVGAIQRQLLALERQGGRGLLRRAGDRYRRPDAVRRRTAAATSASSPRPSWCSGRRSTRPSCSGCSRSCSRSCRRWATWTSRGWSSSSTRRTCCSTTRRRSCSTRSSSSSG